MAYNSESKYCSNKSLPSLPNQHQSHAGWVGASIFPIINGLKDNAQLFSELSLGQPQT
jgi:hypothetical protein